MKKIILLLLLVSTQVFAVEPDEILDNPVQEERARDISKELRCLVCRNENIDESNAGLARDLRLLVRERLVEGDSNAQTIQYIVDRFGEYVLLRPRFNRSNMFLWLSGPLLFLLGGAFAFAFVRGHTKQKQLAALSVDEEKRLNEILDD